MYYDEVNISELVGKVLTAINGGKGAEEIEFICADGSRFKMLHNQDCCESVGVEDVCGDYADLIDSPITLAEESTSDERQEWQEPAGEYSYDDSFTWTFYRIATAKGMVTIRWYGSSNGYYSESVSFERVK